ncbi:RNA polymerase sigma factor [Sphingobacterium sp. MYb382]|uniref:RNA polymerase sigma factor n=1 Tax=Sphingobacterium sp. MYb382 TaxID=2745278 RepID=UPI0030AF160F
MNSQPLYDDKRLLQQLQAGETMALEVVINKYQREVCYFATNLLKDEDVAEEIVDDGFLKIWNGRQEFASLKDLRSYLYVVIRNACLDYLKSPRNRRLDTIEEKANLVPSEENIEAQLIYSELLSAVYEEVCKLPFKQREVFLLSFFEGLSTQEIALKLGISTNAVFINKHEATKAIRLIFKEKNPFLYLLFVYHFSQTSIFS